MSLVSQTASGQTLARHPALPIFLGLLALEALVLLVPGHLAVSAHEVDVLHAASAVMRLVAGEQQHIDFLTPLGPLAFAPVAWFVDLGLSLPRAFLAANLAVAALLIPAALRIASSRLDGKLGIAFGIYLIILASAVVYGGAQSTISISMAYNRWCWAIGLALVVLLLVPPSKGHHNARFDGALIGVGLGLLALTKITFFAALAPVALACLLQHRDWHLALCVGIAGATVAVAATFLFGGVAFWAGYLDNLITAAGHSVRPHPGLDLQSLIGSPTYIPTVLCLLALVVTLRAGDSTGPVGALVLLLLPAFVYMTYQNWGNDPKWVIGIAVLALAFKDRLGEVKVYGAPGRTVLVCVAVASLTIGAPSVMNLTLSPLRNFTAPAAEYTSMLADPRHGGLWVERARSYNGEGIAPLAPIPDPASDIAASEIFAPNQLGTTQIARCVMATGYYGKMRQIAGELEANGHGGKALMFVDVTNPLPLLGNFARVPGEAPWYYGGVAGADAADGLVVPTCGISNNTAAHYLEALNAHRSWSLVERRPHYLLFVPAETG